MTVHALTVSGLSAGYGDTDILHALDLAVPPGRMPPALTA